jgi:hypothetical protein
MRCVMVAKGKILGKSNLIFARPSTKSANER